MLLSTFGGIALLLASIGILGVTSYSASERIREVAIRLSLGAQPRQVLSLVVRQGMVQIVVGILLGVVSSMSLTPLMSKMLFGVRPTDPLTLVGVSLSLYMVGLVATIIPLRRVTKVDPVVILRSE